MILIPAHHHRLFTSLLPFTRFEFVLFVISVFSVAVAGSLIYFYYSYESLSNINASKSLSVGLPINDTALFLHSIFAFCGIALGFYLGYKNNNFKIGYLYVIAMLLLYLYAAYLRKIPLAGNLVVAALMAFPLILLMLFEVTFLKTISFEGSDYVLDILLWQVRFYCGFLFLCTVSLEIVKDIRNTKANEAEGVNTLPIQFGMVVTKSALILVLLVLMGFLAFFMSGFIVARAFEEFSYLAITVILPVLFSMGLIYNAKEERQYLKVSRLIQLLILMGILSIPVFYFLNK